MLKRMAILLTITSNVHYVGYDNYVKQNLFLDYR